MFFCIFLILFLSCLPFCKVTASILFPSLIFCPSLVSLFLSSSPHHSRTLIKSSLLTELRQFSLFASLTKKSVSRHKKSGWMRQFLDLFKDSSSLHLACLGLLRSSCLVLRTADRAGSDK